MKKRPLAQSGFSLVELMAILVILAVCTSLALPSFGKSARKTRFRNDTHKIMARLRAFKLKAISTGIPLTITVKNQQFIVTPNQEELHFANLTLHPEMHLSLDPEILYFSPQGWARSATITLTRENFSQIINIDPLSSRPYTLSPRASKQ